MTAFIANQIIKAQDTKGQGKDKFRAYFVKTSIYERYRKDCEAILMAEGYEDCIVDK